MPKRCRVRLLHGLQRSGEGQVYQLQCVPICVHSAQPYTLVVYSVSGLLMVHNAPQTIHRESLAAGVYIAIMERGADIRKYKFRIP